MAYMQPAEWNKLTDAEKSAQSLTEAREIMAEIRPLADRIHILASMLDSCLGRFASYGRCAEREAVREAGAGGTALAAPDADQRPDRGDERA